MHLRKLLNKHDISRKFRRNRLNNQSSQQPFQSTILLKVCSGSLSIPPVHQCFISKCIHRVSRADGLLKICTVKRFNNFFSLYKLDNLKKVQKTSYFCYNFHEERYSACPTVGHISSGSSILR